jgi:hypothetical protein
MGIKIFGVDIQKVVAQAIPPGALPAMTLRKMTPGVRNPLSLAAGTNPTFADYATRGITSELMQSEIDDAAGIKKGMKKVLLIAEPLATAGVEPAKDDIVVTDEGELVVAAILERDPATAAWVLACRG